MRRQFSYANVVATIALVFAMGGSAVAASHYLITSTRQIKPSVLRALKGSRGATGPRGATGTNGTNGTNGAEGKQGVQGPPASALWARVAVNEDTGAPTLVAGSGVLSVSHVRTGETEVVFARPLNKCSFVDSLVAYGAGYLTPTVEIQLSYPQYEANDPSLVVDTLHDEKLSNGYEFSLAAYC